MNNSQYIERLNNIDEWQQWAKDSHQKEIEFTNRVFKRLEEHGGKDLSSQWAKEMDLLEFLFILRMRNIKEMVRLELE